MKLKKFLSLLILLFIFYSCLEPFNATVGSKSTSLLVVDGMFSNENAPHYVRLTRTISNIDQEVVPVSGATVIIEDDLSTKTELTETENGIYIANDSDFKGIPGRAYTLYIKTRDSKEYRSEPCVMKPSSQIDEVYYSAGNKSGSHDDRKYNGIGIFVSGQTNSDEIEYLRWSYDEDWKFQVPFGPLEVPLPDNTWEPAEQKKICWKSSRSSDINLISFKNQSQLKVEDKELYFINSGESDKLLIRYSTIIKQYSISKEEYDFWRKLEQTNPDVNNIFGEQPFEINGNINCISNPDEKVLGYFQVAGFTSKRIYIENSELRDFRLPMRDFYITCSYDSLMLDKLNVGSDPENPEYKSIYDIYDRFVLSGEYGYELAFPILDNNPLSQKVLGLALSTSQCTDCTLEGDINPPHFWEE